MYSIGEFAKITGLGIHTLRYYEHEGLLIPERNNANRRVFSERDVAWVEFIKRLKDTGMSIREISRYAKLRAAGDNTLSERLNMLMKHSAVLARKIEILSEHQKNLHDKIDIYRNRIKQKEPLI